MVIHTAFSLVLLTTEYSNYINDLSYYCYFISFHFILIIVSNSFFFCLDMNLHLFVFLLLFAKMLPSRLSRVRKIV
jgi:hypothetical protein